MTAEEFYLDTKDELNLPDGWYENEIQTLMQWYVKHVLDQCRFIRDVRFRNFTKQVFVAEYDGFSGYGDSKMDALDSLINSILEKSSE